jgi:hypothetical protein
VPANFGPHAQGGIKYNQWEKNLEGVRMCEHGIDRYTWTSWNNYMIDQSILNGAIKLDPDGGVYHRHEYFGTGVEG